MLKDFTVDNDTIGKKLQPNNVDILGPNDVGASGPNIDNIDHEI